MTDLPSRPLSDTELLRDAIRYSNASVEHRSKMLALLDKVLAEHEREEEQHHEFLGAWQRWASELVSNHSLELENGSWGDHTHRDILGVVVTTALALDGTPRQIANTFVRALRTEIRRVVAESEASGPPTQP